MRKFEENLLVHLRVKPQSLFIVVLPVSARNDVTKQLTNEFHSLMFFFPLRVPSILETRLDHSSENHFSYSLREVRGFFTITC